MTAPGETLEALVRDELRAPVQELVRRLVPQLVAEALNGTVATPVEHRARTSIAETGTKVCTSCREEKPLSQFEKHRATCKDCRRQRARERATQTDEGERPRPGATAQAE